MGLLNAKVKLEIGWKKGKNGNITYVYVPVKKTYHKDKKYTTESRKVIGQLMDDGYVHINENFRVLFPNKEVIYLDENKAEKKSSAIKIGGTTVLNKLMNELQINDLIKECFGSSLEEKEDICNSINDLVCHQIINESAVAQHYNHFIFNHPNKNRIMNNDVEIGSFYKNLETTIGTKLFFKKWNKLNNKNSRIFVSYDSTNHPNYSRDNGVTLNELGKAKVHENIPQINIAYAVQQVTGIPLFYEIYNGSVNDVEQGKKIADFAKDIGINSINMIFDRGYFCEKTVDELMKYGFGFLMMIKTSNTAFKNIILDDKFVKDDPVNFIIGEDVYAQTIEANLFKNDLPAEKRFFHVYYSEEQFLKEKTEFNYIFQERLKYLNEYPDDYKNSNNDFDDYIQKTIDRNGEISFSSNQSAISNKMKEYGYFCLVSSMKLTAEEALDLYRGRDVVEKLFRTLKTHLDANVDRVHSDKSIYSKSFITFISAIIRNEIFQKTKKLRVKNKKDYTVPEIIYELEDIEVVKSLNKTYHMQSCLTKKQKALFNALNCTLRDVDIATSKLNKNL